MQARDSLFVQRRRVGANRREVKDGLGLRGGIPVIGVRRVVKWLCAQPIGGAMVSAVRDQQLRDRAAKCSRQMQPGVARMDVVSNFREEEALAVASRRLATMTSPA